LNNFESRFRNSQIAANYSDEKVAEFGMARNRGTMIIPRISPPGMFRALADEKAIMVFEVCNEIDTFHA
jgi:hypothetical protein